MQIRSASPAELDDIVRIQALAYGLDFNEPAEALLAKVMLSDESSFVAVSGDVVVAYAIAFPWTRDQPVVLHSVDLALSKSANCMYIHDVAVNPDFHRTGIAQELVNSIMSRAQVLSLTNCELVAVQDSQQFWEQNGFRESGIAGTEYGVGAIKMFRNETQPINLEFA